jgi:AcrR family transcriptional regulator
LRAAVEVIDDVGWDRASTNVIAERAGVSIGSLYQYFDSKETLLSKLIEQHHQAVDEVIGSVLARYSPQQPIEEVFRGLFKGLVELHQRDPVLTRVLASGVPQHRSREMHEGKSEQFAVLLAQIGQQRSDIRIRDITAAAYIVVAVVEPLTRWIAHNAPSFLDTDALIDEVVTMLSGYLTGRYPHNKVTGTDTSK